jgi:hypothetical protein
VGVTEDESSISYLRPETAQGIFVNFKNVIDSFHPKLLSVLRKLAKHLEMRSHQEILFSEAGNLSRWK